MNLLGLQVTVFHWGKPRQELMQGPWGMLLAGLLPFPCSACFLTYPKITYLLSDGITHSTGTFHINQSSTCPPDLPTSQSYGSTLSIEVPSSQMCQICVKLTKKLIRILNISVLLYLLHHITRLYFF